MNDENNGFTLDLSKKEGHQRLRSSGGKGTGYEYMKILNKSVDRSGRTLTDQDRYHMFMRRWVANVQRHEGASDE